MNETVKLTGRELDAAVAERVMGHGYVEFDRVCINSSWHKTFTRFRIHDGQEIDPKNLPSGSYAGQDQLPRYSTDIAAAWMVVEKMSENGFQFGLEDYSGIWEATFAVKDLVEWSRGDTSSEAICRAALKAIEND